jgi:alkanesulfonate monooxygenase SsuD/methylene tetrahydromethanopterin reductase-like flavin-dependent oxidoreductase (luciferase family)
VGMRDGPDAFVCHVGNAEDAGVDFLWTGEAHKADAVSTMGFLAAVTKRAISGQASCPSALARRRCWP